MMNLNILGIIATGAAIAVSGTALAIAIDVLMTRFFPRHKK